MMNNPWEGLPKEAPYVLKDDWEDVDKLNSKLCKGGKEDSLIQLDILPVPYVGNPFDARVILLTLNPGFHGADRFHYAKPEFCKALRNSLLHMPSEYPFYLLNPQFKETCGGKYWRERLGDLIEEHGDKKVARAVCVIQWHPYHSASSDGHPSKKKFRASQGYSGWLVEEAIKRKCVMLLLRSRERWGSLVPETKGLPIVNGVRSAYVTKNNLTKSPGLWEKIHCAIASHEQ